MPVDRAVLSGAIALAGMLVPNDEAALVTASFKIDATAPTLSPTLIAPTVVVGQTGVVASPNVSDAVPGLASSGCDPVDTSASGVHSVDCTATDNGGNMADLSVAVWSRSYPSRSS